MAVRTDFVNSFIGENSYFEGRFLVNGVLHINGKFEGNVLKVDQVFIGQTGRVKADLVVSSIVIEGVVIGNIKASTRVMLMPTARVLGDIHTPELIIQNGVILEGRCHISNNYIHSAKDVILKQYNG